jgi:ubiquitin carboxyl-terminal hydrolase 8
MQTTDEIRRNITVRGLSGLDNLGNTCYMNAVLQCLFATDILCFYFCNKDFKKALRYGVLLRELDKKKKLMKYKSVKMDIVINKHKLKLKFKNSVTYKLYQIFTTMWSSNCIVRPREFKRLIGTICPTFEGFDQNDSQELLDFIINEIHDETKSDIKVNKFEVSQEVSNYYTQRKNIMKKIKSMDKVFSNDEFGKVQTELKELKRNNYNSEILISSLEYWKTFMKNNHSRIIDTFCGLMLSEITCDKCCNMTFTFEPFNTLQISIVDENDNNFNTLNECLENHFKSESITYKCDSCNSEEKKATKKLYIMTLPEKLIIQLKRFKTMGQMRRKITNCIDFPLTGLNLDDYCFDKIQTDIYDLYGIVNHSGSLNGGHYIAHTKNRINHKFYEFNDSHCVYMNDDSKLVDNSAYLLFYEKRRKIDFEELIED